MVATLATSLTYSFSSNLAPILNPWAISDGGIDGLVCPRRYKRFFGLSAKSLTFIDVPTFVLGSGLTPPVLVPVEEHAS